MERIEPPLLHHINTHYTHAPWGTNTLIMMKYCANGKTMCGDADSRFRLYGL